MELPERDDDALSELWKLDPWLCFDHALWSASVAVSLASPVWQDALSYLMTRLHGARELSQMDLVSIHNAANALSARITKLPGNIVSHGDFQGGCALNAVASVAGCAYSIHVESPYGWVHADGAHYQAFVASKDFEAFRSEARDRIRRAIESFQAESAEALVNRVIADNMPQSEKRILATRKDGSHG